MHNALENDQTSLEEILDLIKKQGVSYLNSLPERPTTSKSSPNIFPPLPLKGEGLKKALEYFNKYLEPLMVASSGPRYWGFVTGGTTPAAIAGDWLATVYDQNAFATQGQGDLSGRIELNTIDLLLELLNLPTYFTGGFVTGATMSNFTALAAARQWAGHQSGKDIAREGYSIPIPVFAGSPHSSALKSLSMLGMGSSHLIQLKQQDGNREAIDIADLKNQLLLLNGKACILISSAGTVNTVDFDDFNAISNLKSEYNFWWHIDAAFGGFAACSQEHNYLLKGWELADSITIDCHKWLNVPYESAAFFVQQKHCILQSETFQNSNAPYLGNPLDNFSYLNFLPENSRRLKALPVWFSLMAYGKEGITSIFKNSIEMALSFGTFIQGHRSLELLAPVRLNTVCFTLRHRTDEQIDNFLKSLNHTGKVFMTPTVYKGRKGIRAAFVNWKTSAEDIRLATNLLAELLDNPPQNNHSFD